MLKKEEIIKELSNEDYNVRNAVYEYVCNLHLYDDVDINNVLIDFLKNNYKDINYAGLIYSKLNNEIIESLINIHLQEDDVFVKDVINDVLVRHYDLIKDLEYDFDEIIKYSDESNTNALLYKKLKHFSKKDCNQLIELYQNNVQQYYFTGEDTIVTEVIRLALGQLLAQNPEGIEKLEKYIEDEAIKFNAIGGTMQKFYDIHMPYLVYPLTRTNEPKFHEGVLKLYLTNMDFIAYAEDCDYYFSNTYTEEFVKIYIKILKDCKNKGVLEEYFYDIAEYVDSEAMDEFLFRELEKTKDNEVKENIIRILASKFNFDVIPYALDYVKNNEILDEESFNLSLYPLLILKECNDDMASEIIEKVNKEEAIKRVEELSEVTHKMLRGFQELLIKDKPHIKAYKKVRKLHGEILDSMMEYFYAGKFKTKVTSSSIDVSEEIEYINIGFDTNTDIGLSAFQNAVIYKNASNLNCISEEFINNNKFRKKEKIDFLNSMLKSEAGLFEVIEADMITGEVTLRNVLNNKEYSITDIALSSNLNSENFYIYTRIIKYNDISFQSGIGIMFKKEDKFILEWIKENSKIYNEKQELMRFIELYKEFTTNDKGLKIVVNKC